MKTELKLFGLRLNVAPRRNRRRLVVLFYVVLAALLIVSWLKVPHSGGGWIALEFTLLFGPILGGYFGRSALFGVRGIVEPFDGRRQLKYPASASVLRPSSLLKPVEDNDPELRTDERALGRSNYAHRVSHGYLSNVIFIGFGIEYLNYYGLLGGIERWGWSSSDLHHIVFCLLQIGWVFSMTMPQAVLLWTEPDMEPADEGSGEAQA